jgi:hypothetical protein
MEPLQIAIADPPKSRTLEPPPDLQKMVRHFGSYGAIPRETWIRFDKAMRQWQERHRMPEGAIA